MNTGTPPSMVYRQRETDHHYAAAVEAVCAAGFGSTRLLQDRLGIGLLAPLQIRSYLLMSRSSPRSAQPERALQSGFVGARRERGRRPRLQLVLRIRTAARRRG